MPIFKNFADVQILRNVRAFLNVEAGVVRGIRPEAAPITPEVEQLTAQNGQLEQNGQPGQLEAPKQLESGGASGGTGSDGEVPIFFLLGRQKSGTTWAMRLLDAHPEIMCRGEGKFFGRNVYDERIKAFLDEDERDINDLPGTVPPPTSLYNALAENEEFKMWTNLSFWTRKGDAEEYLKLFTRQIITSVMAEKLAGTDKKMVGDKTPVHEETVVEEIAEIFPEAKVVHIVRDGRDVAVSQMHHIWNRARPVREGGHLTPEEEDKRDRYREDPEGFLESGESIFSEQRIVAAAEEYSSKVGAVYRNGPEVLGDRYLEIRYETMLEQPEKEAARIFRFLGARSGKKVVQKCVEATSFEKRAGRKPGEEDSSSPVRKGIAGDWKNVFTERDKEVYKEHAGELLVELGYEQDKNW